LKVAGASAISTSPHLHISTSSHHHIFTSSLFLYLCGEIKVMYNFIFSKHAGGQMLRRGIARKTVMIVSSQPEEILKDDKDVTMTISQSLIKESNYPLQRRASIIHNL
jgi:hypothetical protein